MDCDRFYSEHADPWKIGDADSERYDLYHRLLLRHADARSSLLDIGSGFGAFLSRFRGEFEQLTALDTVERAVTEGSKRHPDIRFVRGSADGLERTSLDPEHFDAIIFSDVVYYLSETGRARALDWIAEHLSRDGIALFAAWCPGGRSYLTADEFRHLIDTRLAIAEEHILGTEHAVFIARPRRVMVALTVDYETWQPIPPGRHIDWERDVFDSTARLLDICDAQGAKLTLFAETGEYLWLKQHDPALAERMAEQWREAVSRGHDVQLHLHPAWLPELGARHDEQGWWWDMERSLPDQYPGDLTDLIRRCKTALEEAIRPSVPDYQVTCFRAGAHETQPFERLARALIANGIGCDSSVYAGSTFPDRHYDYSLAYSKHQPYFASPYDPQLRSPLGEEEIIELPIFVPWRNELWSFDGALGDRFGSIWLKHRRRATRRRTGARGLRRRNRLRRAACVAYERLRWARRVLNRALPRGLAELMTGYGPPAVAQHDYYVLIGHSKGDHDWEAFERNLELLTPSCEFVTLSAMAGLARDDLTSRPSAQQPSEALIRGVCPHWAAGGPAPSRRYTERLRRLIDPAHARLLVLRGRHGVTARELGVAARELDIAELVDGTLKPAAFDCICATGSLELASDVDRSLRLLHRALAEDGALVAAIPADARAPARCCEAHSWRTEPGDVRNRLRAAGFADVELDEVDLYRGLAMPPYPPARNTMIYVRARKPGGSASA